MHSLLTRPRARIRSRRRETVAYGRSMRSYYVLDPQSFSKVLGEDYAWATRNIPLFESANKTLDDTYYFRWRTCVGICTAGLCAPGARLCESVC